MLQQDGISYVRDPVTATVLTDPGGRMCMVAVPARFEHNVIDAALACPGECIFVEEDATYEPAR